MKTTLTDRLLTKAQKNYGKSITPCAGKTWSDCVTTMPNGERALWFNDATGSTRIVTLRVAS